MCLIYIIKNNKFNKDGPIHSSFKKVSQDFHIILLQQPIPP